jgi:dihydropteroate synthase
VPVDLEIARTARVVEAVAKAVDAPISIDTRKAPVAEAALEAGARVVNDVSGLGFDSELAGVAARAGAVLILGHARGTPETMQRDPRYDDALREVAEELEASVEQARAAGLSEEQLAVDPGIGFGKRPHDNLALLARVGELRERLGLPVLVGPSRKSFLGAITGEPAARRDEATWAACAVAVFAGADAVRVHDVAGTARAVAIGRAIRDAGREGAA